MEIYGGAGGAGGPGHSRTGKTEKMILPCGHAIEVHPLEGVTCMNCPECGKSFTMAPGKIEIVYR